MAELESARRTRAAIEELIATPQLLGPDFQVITSLPDGALVGYKATGRGRPGTDVDDTLALLAGAQSLGLVERLDWAFRCLAFDVALDNRLPGELHLTPEPETFGAPCPPRLAVAFSRGRRELDVVAELHDDAFGDVALLRRAVAEMRDWGWRFALTDLADEAAAGAAIGWIRPAYVQVDLSRADRADAPGVRSWIDAALTSGAQLMALGVDTPRQRDTALSLGASCGRGGLLGAVGAPPAR